MTAICLMVGGGCRICPDPFDYSGPVPNGSSPQNDFRARSNGIRPLLAAPRPWPPVVQGEPAATPAAPGDAAAASVLVAAGEAVSADGDGGVVAVVNTAIVDAEAAAAARARVPLPGPPEPATAAAADPAAEQAADPAAAVSPAPVAPAAVAPRGVAPEPAAAEDGASADTEPIGAAGGAVGAAREPSVARMRTGPAAAGSETPGWRRRGPRLLE